MKCDEDKFRAMTFTDYATDGEIIRSSSEKLHGILLLLNRTVN